MKKQTYHISLLLGAGIVLGAASLLLNVIFNYIILVLGAAAVYFAFRAASSARVSFPALKLLCNEKVMPEVLFKLLDKKQECNTHKIVAQIEYSYNQIMTNSSLHDKGPLKTYSGFRQDLEKYFNFLEYTVNMCKAGLVDAQAIKHIFVPDLYTINKYSYIYNRLSKDAQIFNYFNRENDLIEILLYKYNLCAFKQLTETQYFNQ